MCRTAPQLMEGLAALALLLPAAATAAASASASSGGSWRLTFSDEFDSETLNTSNWNVAGGGTHGANELQLYTADEVSVRDGQLSIRTRWNPTDCVPANGSAKVSLSLSLPPPPPPPPPRPLTLSLCV